MTKERVSEWKEMSMVTSQINVKRKKEKRKKEGNIQQLGAATNDETDV